MDSIQQQKLHALSKSRRSHPLKGAFHILLSICLLFLLFIYYQSWGPTNHKSLKRTLSAFISNLLSIDVNKILRFVVVNALLFLVTRGFGFFGFSSNAFEDREYLARSDRSATIEDTEFIAENLILEKNGVPGIEAEEEGEAIAEEEAAVKENHYRQRQQLQLCHRPRSRPHDHDHRLHHHHHPELHQLQKEEEEEEDGQDNYSQQRQQEERGGLVLTEESDERFDNFIKSRKEVMRMEEEQARLNG